MGHCGMVVLRIGFVAGFALLCCVPAQSAEPAACGDYATNIAGKATPECDAAIAAEPDAKMKSTLLFRRALMKDTPHNFAAYPSGLAELNDAIKLDPANADAHHERAFIFNEYGHWQDAKADLDAEIALD